MIIAVVGSGGKTTLVKRMAESYRRQGKKVLVTTSTHMSIEPDTLLSDDPAEIIARLEKDGYVMAGVEDKYKIKELSPATYEAVCPHADVVLVEADGSKHLPVKYPNATEPVIYSNTEEIIIVCGLHALGKPAKEVAHRLELVKQCLGICDDTIITASHMIQLLQEGYVDPLRQKYPHMKLTIHPAWDHAPQYQDMGQYIIDQLHF